MVPKWKISDCDIKNSKSFFEKKKKKKKMKKDIVFATHISFHEVIIYGY